MRTGSKEHLTGRQGRKRTPGEVLLPPETGREPVDWTEIFGNSRPLEVEIGTGKGTFLLARAPARPEVNFLGIEYARSYCAYAADRLRRAGVSNARMLCADAGAFFRRHVPSASLQRLHIYFPDPWPKRRHHKRRLIRPEFVRAAVSTLRPGGLLLIVTDHQGYFRHIRRVLVDWPGLARVGFPRMADADGEIVGTNFERKYIAQGRPFFKLARMKY